MTNCWSFQDLVRSKTLGHQDWKSMKRKGTSGQDSAMQRVMLGSHLGTLVLRAHLLTHELNYKINTQVSLCLSVVLGTLSPRSALSTEPGNRKDPFPSKNVPEEKRALALRTMCAFWAPSNHFGVVSVDRGQGHNRQGGRVE